MEVKKDVDVLIKEVAACNTLTAEEDFALTKAVQDKGTDWRTRRRSCTRCTTALWLVLQSNT